MYGKPNRHRILVQALLLDPTEGTYIEWHYNKHCSMSKCQNFEGTGGTLWTVLVPSNALNGFQSAPVSEASF